LAAADVAAAVMKVNCLLLLLLLLLVVAVVVVEVMYWHGPDLLSSQAAQGALHQHQYLQTLQGRKL
jgi:flagellar basal body-associated protein FliL